MLPSRFRSLGLICGFILVVVVALVVVRVRRVHAALPPHIQTMTCSPNPALVQQPVACSAYVQRDATVSATYGWDLGDGTIYTATSAAPTIPAHPYGSCGTYTVTLTVTDTAAGSARQSLSEVVTGCTSQPAGPLPAGNPASAPTTTSGCLQWDSSGTWTTPAGASYHPTFSFQQGASDSSGMASVTGTVALDATDGPRAGYGGAVSGPLSGTLQGDQLDFIVAWPPKRDGGVSRGHYHGTVTASSISGTTRDEAVPNGPSGPWSVNGTAHCIEGVGGGPGTVPSTTPQPAPAPSPSSTPSPTPPQVSTDTGGSSTQVGTALGPLDLNAYCRAGAAVLVTGPDGPYCKESEDVYVPVLASDRDRACKLQYRDLTATARPATAGDPSAFTCYGSGPVPLDPPSSAPGWPDPFKY